MFRELRLSPDAGSLRLCRTVAQAASSAQEEPFKSTVLEVMVRLLCGDVKLDGISIRPAWHSVILNLMSNSSKRIVAEAVKECADYPEGVHPIAAACRDVWLSYRRNEYKKCFN